MVGVKIINNDNIEYLKDLVANELINEIILASKKNKPLKVNKVPNKWHLLGTGNYAAVFFHDEFPNYAVKVYSHKNNTYKSKKQGIKDEVSVYKKLNTLNVNYFAKLHFYSDNYIIIDRIRGFTLYECLNRGIYIPPNIITDVDKAIKYLKDLDLSSHDIHFKNIIMSGNSAVIVDVSDFLNFEYCPLWNDSKRFYKLYKILPVFPIPELILNLCRFNYRIIYSLLKYFRFQTIKI